MEKDIAFLENEIVEVLAKIEKANYDHHEHKKEFGGEYQYMLDLYDEEIIHWMRRLYRCICVYLELKGLSNILHEFQQT